MDAVRPLARSYPEMTRYHRPEVCGKGSEERNKLVECESWTEGVKIS